jgi:hypothetical protein
MFLFRVHAPGRIRLAALRRLYQSYISEKSPESRGQRLHYEWLSPQQRAQFDAHKYFEVVGSDSGKRYRITYGDAANIHELDEQGEPVAGWCFVPAARLVPGDVMLAQKISLETCEAQVLAVANRFRTRAHAPHR